MARSKFYNPKANQTTFHLGQTVFTYWDPASAFGGQGNKVHRAVVEGLRAVPDRTVAGGAMADLVFGDNLPERRASLSVTWLFAENPAPDVLDGYETKPVTINITAKKNSQIFNPVDLELQLRVALGVEGGRNLNGLFLIPSGFAYADEGYPIGIGDGEEWAARVRNGTIKPR